ncbi:hypothetical protein M2375_002414 [Comamonas sp. BIGb0152]|uniref:DUF4304 domain-containing protein n=1 Tax=Comamonas sp. BIGb0152 TaxID=2940601 RepID=UPI002168AC8E|nr:DUF4304 domain-containing protein [Comamonas sp. BIGb0152]MCS4294181.1 hypothetical protein [Comamonas sp. BIGb0152]
MERKTTTSELRAQFFPRLVAAGFVRQGDIARRVLDGGGVHVVEVQHRPRSAVFQVNLGAHLLALGDVAGGAMPAPQAMRDHDCAWRGSVIAGFRNATDAEFAYGTSAQDAAESVAFLVAEWERQSQAFFAPFSAYPGSFLAAARLAAQDAERHPAHLLNWARVALVLQEAPLAKSIAQAALPRVPERATSLRANLEGILTG